jgi:CO dehydrogenase maturation factor
MKLAFTGKGGVGKTTIVAVFARVLKDRGHKVILIDADPDMNLATVLGVPPGLDITPIVELKTLIAERTGVQPGQPSPLYKMNPKVDDIPDQYSVEYKGLKLLVMGTVQRGGGGCACPENAFLKTLLSYLVVARDEWVLLDMEAGIEHLGRGTAMGVDHMIVVVEPNKTSLETAHRIRKLSADLGVKHLHVVGNKVRSDDETAFLEKALDGFSVLGYIPYSDDIRRISLNLLTPFDVSTESLKPFDSVIGRLEGMRMEGVRL